MGYHIELPDHIAGVCRALREAGFRACPVGGAVRDSLLGRAPEDWDVCTSAPPKTIQGLFERAIPTGRGFGTVTVVTAGGTVEVTPFRCEEGYSDNRRPDGVTFGVSLEEDLSRRDFTINAMALDEDGSIVDLFGGRADLDRKIVRCVGEPERRFGEDALRMLRAVRFSAQLGFTIEEETARAIRKCAPLAAKLSRERIRAELEKTLLSPRPERAGDMIDAGLLDHLYPFPRGCDLSGLAVLPDAKEDRWRGFCAATGFSIGLLPVERRLRRAVERPELGLIPSLALTPSDLMALGLSGAKISAAQKKLALHVLSHPEDNRADRLREILGEGGKELFERVEWLFFDVGSTLVDESEAEAHRIRDMTAGTGMTCEEAYARASELARQNTIHPLKHLGLPLTPWHSEDERIYPQAPGCLARLHERYKLGVIANQISGTAERLERYGVARYLDLIVSSAEEGLEKPDPRIFELALSRAGCAPERAVMIGDRLDNDIAPAKALGMRTIWVRQGFGGMGCPRSRAEIPDAEAADLEGACALLL